jgi:hypothetical protein
MSKVDSGGGEKDAEGQKTRHLRQASRTHPATNFATTRSWRSAMILG